MNVFDIFKRVGGAVLSSVVPGYGAVVSVVNEFLPDGKKISGTSTGTEIEKAIESLPPDKQAELLSKQIDVEIVEIKEHSNVMAILADADKAGASTRPKAAMIAIWFFAIFGGLFALVVCWAIIWAKPETLKNLKDLWPLVLSILGPPIGLLERYFGKRTKEKQARYAGAFGSPLQGGVLSALISAIRR